MKIIKLAGINIAVFLLILFAGECFSRLLGLMPSGKPACYMADWENKFGGKDDIWGGSFADPVNREGFRDIDHNLHRIDGKIRILCLGDSVTYGYNLPSNFSYPARLGDYLQQHNFCAEVFNMARPGWSVHQYLLAYQNYGSKYQPDVVLVGCCLNDVAEMQNNLCAPPQWLVTLYRHSALLHNLIRIKSIEINRVEDLFYEADKANIKNAYHLFFRELTDLNNMVKGDGARMVVFFFPFQFQITKAPPPLPQNMLNDFCSRNSIPTVDLLSLMKRVGTNGFIDADHLSPAGAESVAAHIGNFLMAELQP